MLQSAYSAIGPNSDVGLNVVSHVSSADSITIPDTELLFHGDFKRSGDNLKITGEHGKEFVVYDYFKADRLPTLLSREGAALTGDIVAALAGPLAPGQYAQATAPAGDAQPIGRVAIVTGNATAMRNGVAVALNVGDAVLKGDVLQTGAASALGVIFTDGTTFNLTADARMVLNEFVYDPNGSANSSAISLVQGTISFLAGQVAKTGDMKVDTPVAVMGIRGTAVNVIISSDLGTVAISVMPEADNLQHAVVVLDKISGAQLGIVTNNSGVFTFAPSLTGLVSVQETPKDFAILQTELALVQQVFQTQAVGQQIFQQVQPAPQAPNNPDTKATQPATGTQFIVLDNSSSHDSHAADQITGPATSPTTIKVTIGDQSGTTNTTTTTQTAYTNQQPTAKPDADFVVAAGVTPTKVPFPGTPTATGNVLLNDNDPNISVGAIPYVVSVTAVSAQLHGTLTLGADGTYTYTLDNNNPLTQALAVNETAFDVFSYTMSDNSGLQSSSTLTITIGRTEPLATGAVAPTLTIASNTLSVKEGAAAALNITVAAADGDDTLGNVTIAGIPSDASLTNSNHDTLTISGESITLTAAQLAGLTLQTGETSATLLVTAQASEGGVTATSSAQSIAVTLTPPTGPTEPFIWAHESGAWSNTSNWNNNGFVPGTNDQAEINYGDITVTIGSVSAVGSLSSAATLDITTDGSLTISGNGGVSSLAGTVYNSGTVDIETGSSGATLEGVAVTNSAGAIDVGTTTSGTLLTLDDGTTVTGGNLSIGSSGVLDIAFGSNDLGATLDGVSVSNSGIVQIGSTQTSDPTLTLDDGTTVSGGMLAVAFANTLDIETGINGPVYGATLNDVSVTNNGIIDVGDSTSGAILSLENSTTVIGGTLTNSGTVDVTGGSTSTLNGVSVSNESLALDGNGFTSLPFVPTTSTSVTLTTTKTNDVIILDIVQNDAAVGLVSDAAGLTWHQRAVAGSGANTIYEYYAIAPNALSADVIAVNFAGTASYADLNAFGISGANTSSPFDTNSSLPATPAAGIGTVATSNANDFIFAGYRFNSDATPSAGIGWTAINQGAGYYLSEYQIVSSTQTGLMATGPTLTDENGGIVDAVQASPFTAAGALAVGAGSTLDLNSTTITGGKLTNTGKLDVTGGTTSTLNGVNVTNANGAVTIDAGSTLDLNNTKVADGMLSIGSSGEFNIATGVTLDGVNVTNNGATDVGVTTLGAILTLVDGTTITGGTLTIGSINSGSDEVAIETGATSTGATLDNVTVQNSGTIQVDSAQQTTKVDLALSDGTTVIGGTLSIGTSGEVEIEHGAHGPGATIDQVTVSNSGILQVDPGSTLMIADTVTLQGAGTVELHSATEAPATIISNGSAAELDNVDNTIDGSGEIGGGDQLLTLNNDTHGTIDADVSGSMLGIATGHSIMNAGVMEATNGGTLFIDDSIDNTGTLEANGGVFDISGTVTGIGSAIIEAGGTLVVDASDPQTVKFSDAGGNDTLRLDAPQSFTGSVSGFRALETIDLTNINFVSGTTTATYSSATGKLTITDGTQTDQIALQGNYQNSLFSVAEDAAKHTNVTVAPVPVNSVPAGALAVSEDSPLAIGGLSVSDVAPANDTITVTLSVGQGKLTFLDNVSGGLTSSGIINNGPGSVTLTGSQSAIDTTLGAANAVVYQGNFTGSDTLTMVSNDQINPLLTAQSTVAINVTPTLDPHLWGVSNFPSQPTAGMHLFNPVIAVNSFQDFIAMGYPSSTNFNSANPNGPIQLTENLTSFNSFFLPQMGALVFGTATVTPPVRQSLIVPNIATGNPQHPVDGEGISFFVTQDTNGHNVINESIVGGGNDIPNLSAPVVIENVDSDTIFNLRSSFRQDTPSGISGVGVLSSYDVAWDRFNAAAQTDSINFQIFNANGTSSSTVITPVSLANVPSFASAPAWAFSSGGAGSSYLLAVAMSDATVNAGLNDTGPHDKVHFQGYNVDGSLSSLVFDIQPDLHLYAPGATNHITQELVPTLGNTPGGVSSALQFAPYPGSSQDYAVAWNETVVDAYGTHDQVEFAVYQPSVGVISRSTFQIGDGNPQNVRLGTYSLGGNSFTVMTYGDNTATHIVEFDASGNVVASIVDPTTQTYDAMNILFDGRIAIGYDNTIGPGQTSQYSFKIFDLRTSGINIDDSSLSNHNDQDVAGTHFNDTFIGQNNGSNEYYFIGQNLAVGPAPTDEFTGGQFGNNIAIFPDAISNYTISSINDGSVVIVTKPGDPLHAGSLTLTGVQSQFSPDVFVPSVPVLAFGPSKDPIQSGGFVEASAGSTLDIIGQLFNPTLIDSGAVLEFGAPNNNNDGGNFVFTEFLDTGGTLKLDAAAQNTPGQPPNFTNGIVLSARTNGSTSTDIIDLVNNASVLSASLAGTTLTVNLTGSATAFYQVIGGTPGPVVTAPDGAGGTDLFLTPVGSLWGELTFPLQPTTSSHLYGPSPIQFNAGIAAVGFGITPANYVNSGPDIVLNGILRLDPFLLPYDNGVQIIPISETTVSSFPDHLHLIEPVLNSTTGQVEQILFYETQDASGNPALNQIVINEGTGGPNSPWTIGTPTQIVPVLTEFKIENLNTSFMKDSSGNLMNYSVAWDQFNPIDQTDNVYFDVFNANGSLAASIVPVSSVSGVADPGLLPAWQFRSAGGGVAYASAIATNNAASVNSIQVQGYNSDGSPNNSFQFNIQPDLNAFGTGGIGTGATNQILDEVGSSNVHGVPTSALQFSPNPTSGSGFSFAWNETVTDSFGTHDQVEFALVHNISGVWTVTSRSTFQINNGNLENIRLSTFNYLGNNFEVLAYGDDTATNVLEFDNNGKLVAVVTDTTPQLFSQLTTFGDGRIAIVYNNTLDALDTSQFATHVYDLRTTGIISSYTGIANGQNVDFAGTRFNDVVNGSTGVDSTYYYVGSNTTDASPSDVFDGGGAGSWNTVVFADDRSDYTVTTGASTIITNTDPQHAHAGTLTVDDVQALVFNPTVDPVPQSNGSLEASGDTLLLLSPFPSTSTVTLDSNATLELSQPSTFAGHVSGLSPGNHIDLDGFDNSTTSVSFNGTSGNLTVTDSTHTVALNNAATIALNGSYASADFSITNDGHGGVDIGMTNADQAVADNIFASTSLLQSGSVTIPTNLLLANDTDSNSATLSIQSVDASHSLGSVQLNGNNITYTAPAGVFSLGAGQQASDSFDYTIVDTNGAQSTGHVGLTVVGGTLITGTTGSDIFVSSPANETFTGLGGNDKFVFMPSFGQDVITDFQPLIDVIQIDHSIFANVSELLAATNDDGHGNAVITTLDANNSITLQNVTRAQLQGSQNDFHFT